MELERAVELLDAGARRIQALAAGVPPELARWRPEPGAWSILEVVNHLYDEEREDFRVRLGIILREPDRPWPRIDPGGWVTARRYNERDLAGSLKAFLDERSASLDWLRGLENPDWEAACRAPWDSAVSAGDMLAAWVLHDTLHLRQLVELQHAVGVRLTEPYDGSYAGQW